MFSFVPKDLFLPDTVQAERRDFRIVAVLKPDTERCEERRPGHFKHRPHVFQMLRRGERCLNMTDGFHQILRRRRNYFHFHVPQQSSLLFTRNQLFTGKSTVIRIRLHLNLVAGNFIVNPR